MKRVTVAAASLVPIAAVILYLAMAPPMFGDRAVLHALSMQFMEDLEFKDFRSSSLYHHPDERGRVDIGRALERLFLVKPEALDVRDYRVVRNRVDSSGRRARTLVNVRFDVLNEGEEEAREADLMLYWMRRHPDCPLGGSCEAGTCLDEFGVAMERERDEDADDGDEEESAGSRQEVVTCNVSVEPRWFMNLDSTLEARDYQ